jgi:hypothetical protein
VAAKPSEGGAPAERPGARPRTVTAREIDSNPAARMAANAASEGSPFLSSSVFRAPETR